MHAQPISRQKPQSQPSLGFAVALCALLLIQSGALSLMAQSGTPVSVLMYHNDRAGTGQNLNETVLTPANVNSNTFGRLFSIPVDGFVFAQPLYLAGVVIPGGGTHNVIYVATEHDTLYAFDADSKTGENASPLWSVSFINPVAGVYTIPSSTFGFSDPPEFGVTGTPVIDPASGTLYVVAKMRDTTFVTNRYWVRLYALDVATGEAKFGSPINIQGSAAGTGPGNNGAGQIPFNPLWEAQRCSLLLLNGIVYVAFCSHNDEGPYHGGIVGYNAQTLAQVCYFNTTPNGSQGGIWMSGAAPTVDDAGNLYCITGNGTFDANTGGFDFGQSFLKLTFAGSQLMVSDYFTPFDQANSSSHDLDVGAAGALILPDSVGSAAHPHLLISCSKAGTIYLLDRDNLGHFHAGNDSQIVQSFPASSPRNSLAYFNSSIYYCGITNALAAYRITNGVMSTAPISRTAYRFTYGATPSISANGTNQAIAWAIEKDASNAKLGPGILRAYDAYNLTNQLYTSNDAGTRDQIPLTREFHLPVVANGKVYVATQVGLSVFGLLASIHPRLTINADLEITLEGSVGNTYTIEHSTDLVHWDPIGSITLTEASASLADVIVINPDDQRGFYRALLEP